MSDIVNNIRKAITKAKKERMFPYRMDYHYGYHDALKEVQKIIAQEVRKAKNKR